MCYQQLTLLTLNDTEKAKVAQIYTKVLMAESSESTGKKDSAGKDIMELNPLLLKQNQDILQNLKYGESNKLLNDINFNFGVQLIKSGIKLIICVLDCFDSASAAIKEYCFDNP